LRTSICRCNSDMELTSMTSTSLWGGFREQNCKTRRCKWIDRSSPPMANCSQRSISFSIATKSASVPRLHANRIAVDGQQYADFGDVVDRTLIESKRVAKMASATTSESPLRMKEPPLTPVSMLTRSGDPQVPFNASRHCRSTYRKLLAQRAFGRASRSPGRQGSRRQSRCET